jgi:hypothetical protein
MPHGCKELAFSLYSIFIIVRNFESQLSQFEKLEHDSNVPEWFKANTHELINLKVNFSELSNLEQIDSLGKELLYLSRSTNCEKQLSLMLEQRSKTITEVLLYARKIILFEERFTREYDYKPKLHHERYEGLIAEVDEIAKELGLDLSPI